ncbi:AtuA-related protein [Pseudonocardia sp. T1-2H]|uniref:AtuA-related protein n=1 Tax=Pseudonocardia sp. T1-2H TaxID=3128899 RepID=UPI0031017189
MRAHLAGFVAGQVVRYELPILAALHFVCQQVVDGGITASLALDSHGKTLASRLPALPIAPVESPAPLTGPAG